MADQRMALHRAGGARCRLCGGSLVVRCKERRADAPQVCGLRLKELKPCLRWYVLGLWLDSGRDDGVLITRLQSGDSIMGGMANASYIIAAVSKFSHWMLTELPSVLASE